jgi:hypothetical protein
VDRGKKENMHASYKECTACTLPYIDEINGRDGYCDFCAEVAANIAALMADTLGDSSPDFDEVKSA